MSSLQLQRVPCPMCSLVSKCVSIGNGMTPLGKIRVDSQHECRNPGCIMDKFFLKEVKP